MSLRPQRRKWRQRRLHWLPTAFGWLVVALLAAVALARLVDWDGSEVLAELNSTNGLLYVPSWLVLGVAAVGRRRSLACAALAIVAFQAYFAAPELLAARALPSWVRGAPTFRLLDANAGSDDGNDQMAGYARQIASYHPDLVTFEEITPSDFAQLRADGSLELLPRRYVIHGAAPWGFAIASRYRFHVDKVLWRDGNPFLVDLTLALPDGAIRLWVVHTDAPTISRTAWIADLETIAQRVRRRGDERLLVAGDFNASWGNRGFAAVVQSGLADGAAARAEPYDMTWPQGEPIPPVIRIDHVLAGTGVSVTRIAAFAGPGSDHRELRATIAVRRPTSTSYRHPTSTRQVTSKRLTSETLCSTYGGRPPSRPLTSKQVVVRLTGRWVLARE